MGEAAKPKVTRTHTISGIVFRETDSVPGMKEYLGLYCSKCEWAYAFVDSEEGRRAVKENAQQHICNDHPEYGPVALDSKEYSIDGVKVIEKRSIVKPNMSRLRCPYQDWEVTFDNTSRADREKAFGKARRCIVEEQNLRTSMILQSMTQFAVRHNLRRLRKKR